MMKLIAQKGQFNFLTRSLIGALCACIFIMFASCSQLYNNGLNVYEEENPCGENDVAQLSICVENFCGTESQGATVARTIRSDQPEAENLVFYLYGKASNGTTWRSEKLDLSGTSGNLSVAIQRNNWDLTLAGFASDDDAPDSSSIAGISSKAVLQGGCHIDNRRWNVTAFFTLSDAGLTTSGNVALTLELDGWTVPVADPEYTIAASLLDMNMGNEVLLTLTKDASEEKWTAETVSLAAGYRYLKVTFSRTVTTKNDLGEITSSTEEIYTWMDMVHIQPGTGCTGIVKIQNIIGTP